MASYNGFTDVHFFPSARARVIAVRDLYPQAVRFRPGTLYLHNHNNSSASCCNRTCKWVAIHGVTPRYWSLLGTKRDIRGLVTKESYAIKYFTAFVFYIAVRCGFDKHLYLIRCLNAHNHNTCIMYTFAPNILYCAKNETFHY